MRKLVHCDLCGGGSLRALLRRRVGSAKDERAWIRASGHCRFIHVTLFAPESSPLHRLVVAPPPCWPNERGIRTNKWESGPGICSHRLTLTCSSPSSKRLQLLSQGFILGQDLAFVRQFHLVLPFWILSGLKLHTQNVYLRYVVLRFGKMTPKRDHRVGKKLLIF